MNRYKSLKEVQMKVAITAQEQDLSSKLDPRFGRANWLILVDSKTDQCEFHDNNANLNTASGAGIQTAQHISDLGAQAVIASNVGPNAIKTLIAAKVKVFLTELSTAKEALDSFKEGKLQEILEPNVEGHWI